MKLIQERVKNKNLIKHMLATEAVMRRLAREWGEDEELWGLAGLLHDIDYDETSGQPDRHSLEGARILAELGLPEEIVYAVKVHNEYHGLPRLSRLDKALHAVDPLTGLIVAAALIHPTKRLSAINGEFVEKRFGEKSFARGANREQIARCAELGLSLRRFIDLGVEAMQAISDDLGL